MLASIAAIQSSHSFSEDARSTHRNDTGLSLRTSTLGGLDFSTTVAVV